jgi:hypothetical protein
MLTEVAMVDKSVLGLIAGWSPYLDPALLERPIGTHFSIFLMKVH